MNFHVEPPNSLSNEFILQIREFILLGGKVSGEGLKKRLLTCEWIAYCEENDTLIGVSCLKIPRKEYIEKLENNFSYSFKGKELCELGYSFVLEDRRGEGINSKLKTMLLDKHRSHTTIISTTSNPIARGSLLRRGFVQVGKVFDGTYSEGICLYIKQPKLINVLKHKLYEQIRKMAF